VVKLEFMGVSRKSKGKLAGTLSVCLLGDAEASATAIEHARTDVQKLAFGAVPSAIMKSAGVAVQSETTAENFQSALSIITAKLELIVRIGDGLATVIYYLLRCTAPLIAIGDSPLRQHRVESLDFRVPGSIASSPVDNF
jgi:hypothetical protein